MVAADDECKRGICSQSPAGMETFKLHRVAVHMQSLSNHASPDSRGYFSQLRGGGPCMCALDQSTGSQLQNMHIPPMVHRPQPTHSGPGHTGRCNCPIENCWIQDAVETEDQTLLGLSGVSELPTLAGLSQGKT